MSIALVPLFATEGRYLDLTRRFTRGEFAG
jgi:hypothetical protein